jgi:hypothetical protein
MTNQPSPIRRFVAGLTEPQRRAFIRVGLDAWTGTRPVDRMAVAVMQEIVQHGAEQQRAAAELFGRLETEHRAEVDRIADAAVWPRGTTSNGTGTLTVHEDGSSTIEQP